MQQHSTVVKLRGYNTPFQPFYAAPDRNPFLIIDWKLIKVSKTSQAQQDIITKPKTANRPSSADHVGQLVSQTSQWRRWASGLDLASHHMIFISTEHLKFFTEHVGRLLHLLVKLLYDKGLDQPLERPRSAFIFAINVHLTVTVNLKHRWKVQKVIMWLH